MGDKVKLFSTHAIRKLTIKRRSTDKTASESPKRPLRGRTRLFVALACGTVACFWAWREYIYRRDPGEVVRVDYSIMGAIDSWEMTLHGDGRLEIICPDAVGKRLKRSIHTTEMVSAIESAIREYRPDLLPSSIGEAVPSGAITRMTFETTVFRKSIETRQISAFNDDEAIRARRIIEIFEEWRKELCTSKKDDLVNADSQGVL